MNRLNIINKPINQIFATSSNKEIEIIYYFNDLIRNQYSLIIKSLHFWLHLSKLLSPFQKRRQPLIKR